MSRRNFILLIIISIIILGGIFLYIFSTPKTTPDGEDTGGFFSNLNPFGKTTVVTPKTNETPNTPISEENTPTETEIQKLFKISNIPVAGYTVFQKERIAEAELESEIEDEQKNILTKSTKEFAPAVRYVAKETGNIYQTFVDQIKEEKFTKTIIPRVYEAFFGNNGESVVLRYLKLDNTTIQTFLGNLPKETIVDNTIIASELKGSFLPDNISDLSISNDTSKLFYLINNEDNSIGIVLNLKDNKKTQVIDSAFTEWLSNWNGDKNLHLTTKASAFALGYTYNLDTTKKALNKILGGINGLTTLTSTDGKKILFSDSNLSLNVFNTVTGQSQNLGLRTLAEKCVWNKLNTLIYCAVPKNTTFANFPDSWYQGEISFEDQIWEINLENQNTKLLLNPVLLNGGEEVDGIKLSLDKNEDYLLFVNKKDSILWGYNLK